TFPLTAYAVVPNVGWIAEKKGRASGFAEVYGSEIVLDTDTCRARPASLKLARRRTSNLGSFSTAIIAALGNASAAAIAKRPAPAPASTIRSGALETLASFRDQSIIARTMRGGVNTAPIARRFFPESRASFLPREYSAVPLP